MMVYPITYLSARYLALHKLFTETLNEKMMVYILHHPSKMRRFNNIFPLTGCSVVLLTMLALFKVTAPVCNAQFLEFSSLDIKDLFKFAELSPDTSSYKDLYKKLKSRLKYNAADDIQIRKRVDVGRDSSSLTKEEWLELLQVFAKKENKPIKLLMMMGWRAIPASEKDYKQFLLELYPKYAMIADVTNLIEENREPKSNNERIAAFRKLANECIEDDPLEPFLFAFGLSAINFNDPHDSKSKITRITKEMRGLLDLVKVYQCNYVLRHGIELFGQHPGKQILETFTRMMTNIKKVYNSRVIRLSDLVKKVLTNMNKPYFLKNKPAFNSEVPMTTPNNTFTLQEAYEEFNEFTVFEEAPESGSLKELSVGFFNAIKDFAMAKDFEEAKKNFKRRLSDWQLWSHLNVETPYTLTTANRNAIEHLARATCPIVAKKHPEYEYDWVFEEVLSYYEYKNPNRTEKYNQCLVTLIFSKDESIIMFKEKFSETWPEQKDKVAKHHRFCSVYSEWWRILSLRKFRGISEDANIDVAETCKPDSEAYNVFLENIIGGKPDSETVAKLLLDWYYAGSKVRINMNTPISKQTI